MSTPNTSPRTASSSPRTAPRTPQQHQSRTVSIATPTLSPSPPKASLSSIDPATLSPEDLRLFRLYGRIPTQSQHFARHLKDRKYFDSCDYAMSKAGHGDSLDVGAVGALHPAPGSIPHPTSLLRGEIGADGGKVIGGMVVSGVQGRRKSSLSGLPLMAELGVGGER
ncbi:hypothetical protein B0T18DRAFT_428667 [Schizothecium vesticola]|uniref:mRNA stability protein n=1 Tax=Schizothecium vesticola TaxID=314040 RepID=A0AA40ETZ2_9PEZI|nr:hypothetical protein B0T18DRAFT_428667 [Schizothecium vesticola]